MKRSRKFFLKAWYYVLLNNSSAFNTSIRFSKKNKLSRKAKKYLFKARYDWVSGWVEINEVIEKIQ